MTSIPAKMRAVQIRDYEGKPESLAVVEIPVPRPGPGEVLIRMFASPVNPSDLTFIRGLYGFKKALPAMPGFEGSGTVVAAEAGSRRGMSFFGAVSALRAVAGWGGANPAPECGVEVALVCKACL